MKESGANQRRGALAAALSGAASPEIISVSGGEKRRKSAARQYGSVMAAAASASYRLSGGENWAYRRANYAASEIGSGESAGCRLKITSA
jgi:hypothetical protein